jgi:hypothetical protein
MGRSLVRTVAGFGSGNILVKLGGAIADGISLGDSLWEGNNNQMSGLAGIAGEAFDFAMGEAATEGQISLIMAIGPGGFQDAVDMAIENERDASGLLTDMTDHPEAIGDILEGAEALITDALSQGKD